MWKTSCWSTGRRVSLLLKYHSMKMQYSPNLHGRLMYILMCSKWLFEAEMLSCRTHLYESDCQTSQSMRVGFSLVTHERSRSMTHKLHPRGRPTVATYQSRLYVKLDSQKTCSSRPSPLFKLLTSVA